MKKTVKAKELGFKAAKLEICFKGPYSHNNIKIEDDVVIIEISCRRTKIESTLIKLYWLCGYALDTHNLFYSEIRVILNIQKKQIETLVTIAKGKDVIKLGQRKSSGYSSFSNFLDKLEVYRKQD